MTSQHEFDLIKGDFAAEDALDILLGMIQGKINYHNGKAFSLEERYGKDYLNCRDRVTQLNKSRAELEQFMSELLSGGHRVRVSSHVHIEVLPEEEGAEGSAGFGSSRRSA